MTQAGTATDAPTYIPRDTYTGRHSIHRPVAKVKADSFTAAELAALAPAGVVWESFGATFPGRESFGRSRYVADTEGNLHIYDSNGRKVLIHPAGRSIRVLTA
jgi:hypothetical protein